MNCKYIILVLVLSLVHAASESPNSETIASPNEKVKIVQKFDILKDEYYFSSRSGDQILTFGERCNYRSEFKFIRDSKFILRSQKTSAGNSDLFLYKISKENEVYPVTSRPLSDLAWDYLIATEKLNIQRSDGYHSECGLLKGIEDNYDFLKIKKNIVVLCLRKTVEKNKYISNWKCVFDLDSGDCFVPAHFEEENKKSITWISKNP